MINLRDIYTLQRRQRQQIIDEINQLNQALAKDPINSQLQQKLNYCWESIHRLSKNQVDVAAKTFGLPVTCS